MGMLPLLAGVAALLLAAAALMVMGRGGTDRALRMRVRAARGISPATPAQPVVPIRRVETRRHGAGMAKLLGLLGWVGLPPGARVVPWQVVAGLASIAALSAFWQAQALAGPVAGLLGAALGGVMTSRGVFGWQRRRYAKALFLQIPDTMGLMLRALRAGLPVTEALRSIAAETGEPTRGEFQQVVGELAIGQSVDAAIWALHERTGLTEYAFLAVTLGLQAQTGGSLTDALENLGDMVRKRVALAGKAKAMAGEARFSALVLIALPFLCGAGLMVLRPGYLDVLFNTDTGFKLLMTGMGFLVMGMLAIRYLIRMSTEA